MKLNPPGKCNHIALALEKKQPRCHDPGGAANPPDLSRHRASAFGLCSAGEGLHFCRLFTTQAHTNAALSVKRSRPKRSVTSTHTVGQDNLFCLAHPVLSLILDVQVFCRRDFQAWRLILASRLRFPQIIRPKPTGSVIQKAGTALKNLNIE